MKKNRDNNLSSISDKRIGGAVNIKGLNFQFLYACYKIFDELSYEQKENSIGLEGIEDIDILHNNEYIQLKSSKNTIDASKFWDMHVLKNYLEVYQQKTDVTFRFVHNTTIAKGYLKGLVEKNIKSDVLQYWTTKLHQLGFKNDVDIKNFLQKITFEKVNKEELITKCKKLFIEKFGINSGTEEQFLISLWHHVSIWSERKKVVNYLDLLQVLQLVKDSFSKSPKNRAIEQNWITKVAFDSVNKTSDSGYFDGKSAKPMHISMGLPTRREHWETCIQKSLENVDITVIKASSGQGKSTLAWQVAYSFNTFGFHIYQLNYLDDIEKIEQVFDYIEARLKISQLPIIVIDGLNQIVSQWGLFIERLSELPVKVIVTTREEDWYRFGMDASQVQYDIIDIQLLEDEAQVVFTQLKSKNRIHKDIKTWEPVWEQIESKGLLIEYVYLLTHGKMIKERLEQQIKQLNSETDASAKIEILRLVALADILNIKIRTKKLTSYIQSSIGFQSDRGELYKMLEQEYYVQFDKIYIEGLHPVRSQHLVDILQRTISIEESLIALLRLMESNSIYDYFIAVPFLLSENEKEDFFKNSAKIMSDKNFDEMVQAIDGLMHYEPYKYWIENKEIFEEVYTNGLISLFLLDISPFTKLDTFESLEAVFENNESIVYLVEQKNKLSSYSFKNSDITLFSYFLSQSLDNLSKQNSRYAGLGFLTKWFKKLNLEIPTLYDFDEDFLLENMLSRDIKETMNLYNYFDIKNPEKYLQFLETKKLILIAHLKQKTESLTIKEKDDEIYIEYLLEDSKAENLNECSMKRIDIINSIFPKCNRYHTKVIYLPFPNEELYKWIAQSSLKQISKENLFERFDVHLNQIWNKTINKNYSCISVFEWQEQHVKFRQDSLNFVKKLNKVVELMLEKKKYANKVLEMDELYKIFFAFLRLEKAYPHASKQYHNETKFENELIEINGFKSSFRNFLNQFVSIFEDKSSHESYLAMSNLRDACSKLYALQNSFEIIQNETYNYFEMKETIEEEKIWFERLLKTISYYIDKPAKKVIVAKESVEIWWNKIKVYELSQVYNIIQGLEQYFTYKIIYPSTILEMSNIKEIAIGIEDVKEDDLGEIISKLVDLHEMNIDFVNIIFVENSEALTHGIRISKLYLGRIKHILDGGEYAEDEFENSLYINITEELLETLSEKITLKKTSDLPVENNLFLKIMFDIWKLTEYRNRLDINSDIERDWLVEKEVEFTNKIKKQLIEVDEDFIRENFKSLISKTLYEKEYIQNSEIIECMNTIIL